MKKTVASAADSDLAGIAGTAVSAGAAVAAGSVAGLSPHAAIKVNRSSAGRNLSFIVVSRVESDGSERDQKGAQHGERGAGQVREDQRNVLDKSKEMALTINKTHTLVEVNRNIE